jgi:predicted aspartyl protease
MLIATGFFDGDGNPSLNIGLAGSINDSPIQFDVIIDTGFSGFISMPLIKAFPLGLALVGTTDVTLADGSSNPKLIAVGKASVGDRTHGGIIILEQASSDILIGMDFLRSFGLALSIDHKKIILCEADEFEKVLTETAERLANKNVA